jgi:hypothetical protein
LATDQRLISSVCSHSTEKILNNCTPHLFVVFDFIIEQLQYLLLTEFWIVGGQMRQKLHSFIVVVVANSEAYLARERRLAEV